MLLIAPALTLATAVASPAFAAGSSSSEDAHHTLHATAVSTPAQLFGLGPSGCTNLNPDTGRCLIAFFQQDTFNGDVVGQDTDAGSLSVQLPALTGDVVALATFRGTVRGCPGQGTATLRLTGRLATPGHDSGAIQIVEGAGSGGLAALEGSGHFDATIQSDGTASGTEELNIHCAEHR